MQTAEPQRVESPNLEGFFHAMGRDSCKTSGPGAGPPMPKSRSCWKNQGRGAGQSILVSPVAFAIRKWGLARRSNTAWNPTIHRAIKWGARTNKPCRRPVRSFGSRVKRHVKIYLRIDRKAFINSIFADYNFNMELLLFYKIAYGTGKEHTLGLQLTDFSKLGFWNTTNCQTLKPSTPNVNSSWISFMRKW